MAHGPDSEKYIESFSTIRDQKNAIKYSGFQSKIYRLQENDGNDHELDLSIMFVCLLPVGRCGGF